MKTWYGRVFVSMQSNNIHAVTTLKLLWPHKHHDTVSAHVTNKMLIIYRTSVTRLYINCRATFTYMSLAVWIMCFIHSWKACVHLCTALKLHNLCNEAKLYRMRSTTCPCYTCLFVTTERIVISSHIPRIKGVVCHRKIAFTPLWRPLPSTCILNFSALFLKK